MRQYTGTMNIKGINMTTSLKEKTELEIDNSLSSEQLIEYTTNALDDKTVTLIREELLYRGKDNIQARITIKKHYKALINNLGEQINNINALLEDKILKTKMLTIVSILDRLQIEWQKYDLGLRN